MAMVIQKNMLMKLIRSARSELTSFMVSHPHAVRGITALGAALILASPENAFAGGNGGNAGGEAEYDEQVTIQVCRIVAMSQGMFGALVMSVAGLVAIVGAAMGSYRSAMNALAVGLGAFLIRPVIILFFGDIPCGDYGMDIIDLFNVIRGR